MSRTLKDTDSREEPILKINVMRRRSSKAGLENLALFTDTYAEKHIIALINHTQLMNLRDKMIIYIYRKGTEIEEEEKELKTKP